MTVTFKKMEDFDDSLLKTYREAGKSVKAATQELLTDMSILGKRPNEIHIRYSRYGESRIKDCFKFRPTAGYRLITVFTNKTWLGLFLGTKNEAEKYLNKHKGKCIKTNSNGEWFLTKDHLNYSSSAIREIVANEISNDPMHDIEFTKPFISKLSATYKSKLRKLCDGHPELLFNINSWDSKTNNFHFLDSVSVELGIRIVDIFSLLSKEGETNIRDAMIHIDNDELYPVTNNTESSITQSSIQIHNVNDAKHWLETIDKAAQSDDWKTWMTRMHPDQEKIVNEDYPVPVYLKGVSGSGKTSVIVSRAERLAKKYPNEKILIATLNRSLAALIDKLIKTKCGELNNIEVKAFFTICQDLLRNLGEDMRLFDDKSDKYEKHVDVIWDEYYRCENHNDDAAIFHKTHDSLISSDNPVYPYTYIREELDWVRSAFKKGLREEQYLKTKRLERKNVDRIAILRGLEGWEKKIWRIGVTDYLNFSSVLTAEEYFDSIEPTYRCILVDESQDFGTTELQIIRKLANAAENDLFICGDPAQKISHKHQNILDAGITKRKSLKSISKNYRNTREIIEFANRVLKNNMKNFELDDKDIDNKIVDPISYDRSGAVPVLVKSSGTLSEEIAYAIHFLRILSANDQNKNSKYCIAICGFNEHEIFNYSKLVKLPTLDGSKTLEDGSIFLSDLENTKGFEFDSVIILNCSDLQFPHRYAAPEEIRKDLSRLYVAMTRAKNELIISYSNRISDFFSLHLTAPHLSRLAEIIRDEHKIRNIEDFNEKLKKGIIIKDMSDEIKVEILDYLNGVTSHHEKTWYEFFKLKSIKSPETLFPVPKHIDDLLGKNLKISEMRWDQFLNTTYAIGLSKDLINALRNISNNAALNNRKVKLFYDEQNAYQLNAVLKSNVAELMQRLNHIKSLGYF